MIDLALINVIEILIVIFMGVWKPKFDTLVGWIAIVLYSTFFLALYSRTPGKMLFGMKVINKMTGENVNFEKSLGRSLSYILSTILFGLGFWAVAFDKEEHKGWHDRLAGTVVLQDNYNNSLAVSLSLISAFFIIVLISIAYGADSINSPYTIRTDERKVENKLYLNQEVFNRERSKDAIDTKSSKKYVSPRTDESATTPLPDLDFDTKKILAPVVSLACPLDDGRGWNLGSGVIITADGLILTSYHIIKDTSKSYCTVGITNDVSKSPEYTFYADYSFYDEGKEEGLFNEEIDIAVLQIINEEKDAELPQNFPTVSKIGTSDELQINDTIYIVGYPSFGGGTITLTEGVMSGRVGDDLIKTSAKLDSGNSGGGAFNKKGELIGIPTFIGKGKTEGLGYIIGIDSVEDWLAEIAN